MPLVDGVLAAKPVPTFIEIQGITATNANENKKPSEYRT